MLPDRRLVCPAKTVFRVSVEIGNTARRKNTRWRIRWPTPSAGSCKTEKHISDFERRQRNMPAI
jgi:hypothetical protein